MAKKELRAKLRKHRPMIPAEERRQHSCEICDVILHSKEYQACDTVLSYYPINDEVDVLPVLRAALSEGKRLALPKVVCDKIIFFCVDSLDELVISHLGIPEPDEKICEVLFGFSNSICIVPALGIDKNGHRIGYGGGYYDRFLKRYTGLSIGVAYPAHFVSSIPAEEHDVKLNMSVIPGAGIVRF